MVRGAVHFGNHHLCSSPPVFSYYIEGRQPLRRNVTCSITQHPLKIMSICFMYEHDGPSESHRGDPLYEQRVALADLAITWSAIHGQHVILHFVAAAGEMYHWPQLSQAIRERLLQPDRQQLADRLLGFNFKRCLMCIPWWAAFVHVGLWHGLT